jgi:hypothetical protein
MAHAGPRMRSGRIFDGIRWRHLCCCRFKYKSLRYKAIEDVPVLCVTDMVRSVTGVRSCLDILLEACKVFVFLHILNIFRILPVYLRPDPTESVAFAWVSGMQSLISTHYHLCALGSKSPKSSDPFPTRHFPLYHCQLRVTHSCNFCRVSGQA